MILQVSLKDLRGRPARTAGMVGVVAVLAFALMAGYVLNISLSNGADAVESRLGADVMVVPDGYGDVEEALIISGEPSTFYMDRSIVDDISKIDGIGQYSTQVFLTSIPDADCCDFLVQIIGYDPETDFTVTPWIAETYSDEGIIVGSEIYPSIYPDGLKVTFFGHQFKVAAKLSPSGTGADTTVYMDMDTLKQAIAYAGPTSEAGKVDPDNQVSNILIKAQDGYDVDRLVRDIRVYDVDVVESSDVVSDITGRMGSLIGFIDLFQVTIVFMAAVVLVALFSLYVFENRKEYAVLRMIGASRASVSGLVLSEAAIVSVIGAVVGVAIALAVVVPLSGNIGDAIGMPYMQAGFGQLLTALLTSFVIAAVVGSLSALVSAVRIAGKDAYSSFREGE